MKPEQTIDAYAETARRPRPGTLWVWEPTLPHARAVLKVLEVKWNGEEWWVKTETLTPHKDTFGYHGLDPNVAWNDLSRFWEACHHVATNAGPAQGATRSGKPRFSERSADE